MYRSVWKSKVYGAFVLNHRVVLHAIDARPARWRDDADSSPLDEARTAASSPAPDALVDFHTGTAQTRKEIGPVSLSFEIPMYNVSNLQVKYLRIAEASQNYNPYRWVRYVTRSSSYVCRCR
jgi:hypothetical protein